MPHTEPMTDRPSHDDPLVIAFEDLDDEPATPARLVVDFSEAASADPEMTVAPSHLQQQEYPVDAGHPDSAVDPPATDGGAGDDPAPLPRAAPVLPAIELPRLSPAPAPLVIEPDPLPGVSVAPSSPREPTDGDTTVARPEQALQRPPPSAAALLLIEAPVFLGDTVLDDISSVAAFVDRHGRPPIGQLVDDQRRKLSHPLVDVRDVALSADRTMIALASTWSQTLFGLDPVADHLLMADPGLGALDPGPYDRSVMAHPQLSVASLEIDGSGAQTAGPILTAAAHGITAPAYSPDGHRIAVLEWRGDSPSYGTPWVIRIVDLETLDLLAVADVPASVAPGELPRLAFSPRGGHLILSGTGTAGLLDLEAGAWTPLPLAGAAWAPARGPGWVVGPRLPGTDDPEAIDLVWFDLATWNAEPIGVVSAPPGVAPPFGQLDLAADGRFLAGVVYQRADQTSETLVHRVGVVDLHDLTVDLIAQPGYDGIPQAARDQRSPRWIDRAVTIPDDGLLAANAPRRDVEALDIERLDLEFGDDLEALSEGYFIAATHPDRPGTGARECQAFTRRAIEVIGERPWLDARVRLLPEATTPGLSSVLWRDEPARSLDAAVRTGRAACALADGAPAEAITEWEEALAADESNQEAALQLHYLLTADPDAPVSDDDLDVLARAGLGPDRRLGAEARLRRAYLLAVRGADVGRELDVLARSDDPWFAARAQPIAAHVHLLNGRRDEAKELLVLAATGPHEEAARSALALAEQAGWADEPEFVAVGATRPPQGQ